MREFEETFATAEAAATQTRQSVSARERSPNEATKMAQVDTLLTPRFYTTDHAAIDAASVEPVSREWEGLMAEFEADNNDEHFTRPPDMASKVSELPPALYQEFNEFLISSITSEFSGCVLYAELKKKVKNKDMKDVFVYMARD